MIVTKGWIESVIYSRGVSITAKQLAILGLSWPPQKGWKEIVDGKEISDDEALKFEEISIRRAKKLEAKGKLNKAGFRHSVKSDCIFKKESKNILLSPSKKPEDFPDLIKLTLDDLAPADLSRLDRKHRRSPAS